MRWEGGNTNYYTYNMMMMMIRRMAILECAWRERIEGSGCRCESEASLRAATPSGQECRRLAGGGRRLS
jgi:hypothetical protein